MNCNFVVPYLMVDTFNQENKVRDSTVILEVSIFKECIKKFGRSEVVLGLLIVLWPISKQHYVEDE